MPARERLVRTDGTVKIADLGIATAADLTSVTATGIALGTVAYMAPEQLEGGRVAAAADVYALAAVAFEMLSGRKARTGSTPMEIVHRIATEGPPDLTEAWPAAPPEAAGVLRRAMSTQPAERPRSAGELVSQLEEALGLGSGAEVAQVPPEPSAPQPVREETAATPPIAPVPTRRTEALVPPMPRAAPPRRRRSRTLAAIALVSVLAAVAAVLALRPSPDEPAPAAKPETEAGDAKDERPRPSTARPEEVARSFYERAAADRYEAAWSLAGPGFRAQLGGFEAFQAQFSTLESISFDRAQTTSETPESSTVQIATTAVHTDRTDTCSGQVSLARGPGGRRWVIDRIAVDC